MSYAVTIACIGSMPCYLTTGWGDPPRTFMPSHASRYKTLSSAKAAITRAKKTTPLKERIFEIVPYPEQP